MFVFFISHRRVWALVEDGKSGGIDVTLGGNTNRNQFGFEDKFQKIVAGLEKEDSKRINRNEETLTSRNWNFDHTKHH